jgi:hypothetical protein
MARAWRLGVVLLLAVGSSCSGAKAVFVPDAIRGAQRWALLSVFFRSHVDQSAAMGDDGLLDVVAGAGRERAMAQSLKEAQPAVVQSHQDYLARQLGGAWLPVEEVVAAPGYADLPRPWDHGSYDAPLGMRVLHMEKPAEMGAMAAQLGVDAVVVVRHAYALTRPDRLTFAVDDTITLVVVGRDGKVWWDVTRAHPGGRMQARDPGKGVANLFDLVTPEQARDAMVDTAAYALDTVFLPLRMR